MRKVSQETHASMGKRDRTAYRRRSHSRLTRSAGKIMRIFNPRRAESRSQHPASLDLTALSVMVFEVLGGMRLGIVHDQTAIQAFEMIEFQIMKLISPSDHRDPTDWAGFYRGLSSQGNHFVRSR